MVELLCTLATVVVLLVLGFSVGSWTEAHHFHSIALRHQRLQHMLVSDLPNFPYAVPSSMPPQMLVGEVVVASDYFKSFAASLRNLVGGRVQSYERMLERARQEATLRVLEQAHALGYNAVCNLRIESVDVGGNTAPGRMPMASVLAFGTAYVAQLPQSSPAPASAHDAS